MAKKAEPVITYTEILCRAIRSVELELSKYHANMNALPADHPLRNDISNMMMPLQKKLNAMKQLYEIETGVEYI